MIKLIMANGLLLLTCLVTPNLNQVLASEVTGNLSSNTTSGLTNSGQLTGVVSNEVIEGNLVGTVEESSSRVTSGRSGSRGVTTLPTVLAAGTVLGASTIGSGTPAFPNAGFYQPDTLWSKLYSLFIRLINR